MLKLLRTSIAARSTAVILMVVGLAGAAFVGLAVQYARQQEYAKQQERLGELLDTVQRTLSIACFLSDKQLANEVALGLIGNHTVAGVEVRAGGVPLARQGKSASAAAVLAAPVPDPREALVRRIASPFNADKIVGEVVLIPDAGEILKDVFHSVRDVALLVVMQIGVIGLSAVLVVNRFVTRPIAAISARLHELRAETGEKLEVPRGNELDEIGRLVHDVNAMADSLTRILDQERSLRVELGNEERKFRAIFEHADTGIFLVDESGRMVSWNPAFARCFGAAETVAPGGPLPMLAELMGERGADAAQLITQCLGERRSVGRDFTVGGSAGVPTRWLNVILSPVEDQRLQGVVNDVSEQKRAELAAQELAATDRLTGLANRLGFDRRLQQMIDDCYRDPGRRFAMLMIDLDWFKQVNDTYGHAAGDAVLVSVAGTLEAVVRKSDFVARLGGDEFVVLLDAVSSPEIVERVARKIIEGVGRPIAVGEGRTATIGASIGASAFGGAVTTKEELVRRADEAMYRAKESGRNAYRWSGET